MPFTRLKSGKYKSPSGRLFTKKQVRRYYARGGSFDTRQPALFCDAIRKGDPTGTLDIRRSYGSKGEQRWRKVLGVLVQQLGQSRDILGLDPAHLSVLASDNRVRALQSWLSDLIDRMVIEGSGEWLRPMIAISYARAVARGMRLTKKPIQPSDQQSTIGALWALSVAELQGIAEATVQQIVREASLALLHHDRPTNLVRAVQSRIKAIGITRTRAMIELMVVKAFSTGTLDQFAAAGISKVGLIPETIPRARVGDARITDAPRLLTGPGAKINRLLGLASTGLRTIQRIRKVARGLESFSLVNVETAGDEDVCPICQDIEDENPYTINEARSLIPAHPRCRCAFIPLEDDYQDANPYHEPGGSPIGGQFARAPGQGSEMHAPPKPRRPLDPDFTKAVANKVAKDLNYDGRITITPESRTFVLNGETMSYAGSANMTDIGKGITLYTSHLSIQSVAGVTAHEIEHIKFARATAAYIKERDQIELLSKTSGLEPDAVMKPDGSLKEPYDKQFSTYTKWHEAYNSVDHDLFSKSDGVSDYSSKYWRAWHAGKISTDLAIHETLAEMARIKYETDKFPEHTFMGTHVGTGPRGGIGKKMQEGRAAWRKLYKTVDEIWK